MKPRDCDHWPKTKVMWNHDGTESEKKAFEPIRKDKYFAQCEKCGVWIRPAWVAENETVVTEKETNDGNRD